MIYQSWHRSGHLAEVGIVSFLRSKLFMIMIMIIIILALLF